MREIRIVGMPGGSRGSTPLQTEARDYFARMTTPPSAAFRTAANRAIYQWKQAGLWPKIKGLWLLCADSAQASLLSVIGDTPRDAVVVGAAPTHTALKGFSGFDNAHRIKFPITAAMLGGGYLCTAFIAAILAYWFGDYDGDGGTGDGYYRGPIISSDAGVSATIPGNFGTDWISGNPAQVPSLRGGTLDLRGAGSVVGGSTGFTMVLPSTNAGGGNSLDNVSSNYITATDSRNALNQGRLCAYGFLDTTATPAQASKFLAILSSLLHDLGAMD